MDAEDLQAELQEALLRGAKIVLDEQRALGSQHPALDADDIDTLMHERAANIAGGYASRTHADANTTEGLAVEALQHARDLMRQALELRRIRSADVEPSETRHNDRRKLSLSKINAALALWGRR